ncbi:MAG: glycoside hydrolase family 95 protein, partial [Candidatus Aenigmatarchaeota archaeon]
DHQIIRYLFQKTAKAAEILGIDGEFRTKLLRTCRRIAPNQIGRWGQLQEWLEDKDNPRDRHRHVSHLWAVFPGEEITPQRAELFAAARRSLLARGDGGTGWSKAWKVNLWARFLDGDHAYKLLADLIRRSTFPNMFDSHPPFQIDGNFGGTSGICQMLLQSYGGTIRLLPALPKAWRNGCFRGLRARGGLEVSCSWSEGKAKWAELKAEASGVVVVKAPPGQVIKSIKVGEREIPFERLEKSTKLKQEIKLRYEKGKVYLINF